MPYHQRVLTFSLSNAFASCTDLGILTSKLWVQTKYFDFSFPMIRLRFASTCRIHHASAGSPAIRWCTSYSDIFTGYEFFISLRVSLVLCSHPSIVQGLQSPLLSICDALFWYTLWWMRPDTLLMYRRTYGWQSPGIVHANFSLFHWIWLSQPSPWGSCVFFLLWGLERVWVNIRFRKWYRRQKWWFINSVPGLFCFFYPLTVSSSGTPSFIRNVLVDCPVLALLAIRCIPESYVPL